MPPKSTIPGYISWSHLKKSEVLELAEIHGIDLIGETKRDKMVKILQEAKVPPQKPDFARAAKQQALSAAATSGMEAAEESTAPNEPRTALSILEKLPQPEAVK
ncbi:hypothetical protein HDU96_007081, partial [Phlyctochytrium bullatum]